MSRTERETNLRTRFGRAERIGVPDLWPDIERRSPRFPVPPPHAPRLIALATALAVAAAGIGFAVWALHGTHPAPASTTCSALQTVQHPQHGTPDETLEGILAIGPDDVWAVGYQGFGLISTGGTIDKSLLLHWDGQTWREYPAPYVHVFTSSPNGPQPVAGRIGELSSISASGPDDVWAVGSAGGPLVDHWDGSGWRAVPTPKLAQEPYAASISGVTAIAPDDAWVVGSFKGAVTEHWDGRTWKVVPAAPVPGQAVLSAVGATGPTDVWAVGYTESIGADQRLRGEPSVIEHWDGTGWTRVPSPNPFPSGSNVLTAVTVISTDDVWAVGWSSASTQAGRASLNPLAIHWDGTAWRIVPTPQPPGARVVVVKSVAAVSSQDIWMVGWYRSSGPTPTPFIERWNGQRWTLVRNTLPGPSSSLSAVSALPSGELWMSGTSMSPSAGDSTSQSLILHRVCR